MGQLTGSGLRKSVESDTNSLRTSPVGSARYGVEDVMVSPHNFYVLMVDPYNHPGCKSTVERAFPAESVPTGP